jgi:ATP-dependent Clp protease, protease subunit
MGKKTMATTNRFWQFRNVSEEEAELRISGEIVSDDDAWIYEWFEIQHTAPNPFREALAQYKGKNLTVWIDSWGGDVLAAAGIYNALKEHRGKVTVKIDGKAVSAASVIAMAGDEVFMSPVGIMMIHNPWTFAKGEAKDMRHVADVLDEIKDTIINAYQLKTGLSRNKISRMMDEETWMSAKKAVSEGFADGILYTDNAATEEDDATVQNAFSFSRLAIQNSVNAAMRRFLEKWQNIHAQNIHTELNTKSEEGPALDGLEIKNLKDLKKHFPDLCNELEKEAREQERNRIKEIDEISATIDPALVAKAKYDEPMTAQELAFEALKADAKKGSEYIANREKEIQNSGAGKVKAVATDIENKEELDEFVDKIAASANEKRKKGSVTVND